MSYVRKITAGGVTKDVKDSEALEASSVFPAYVKKTYSVGDKCTYNGRVKKCKVEIATPEEYTEAHWEDAPIGSGLVESSALQDAVDEWLEEHPEATTTVQDGSITKQKLDQNLQQTVDDVGDLKSAIIEEVSSYEDTGRGLLSRGNFKNGQYNPSTQTEQSTYVYRIGSRTAMTFKTSVVLNVKSGFRFYPWMYSSNGWTTAGWQTSAFNVPANTPLMVYIARVSEDTSETADIAEFLSAVTVTYVAFNTLCVGSNRQYTTIQSAINDAIDGDFIIVYPGTYTESVDATAQKYVSIIGVDRDKCILQYSGWDYDSPALAIGRGTIKNLTIHATDTGEETDHTAYALHIDTGASIGTSTSPQAFYAENCRFIGDVRQPVGIGLKRYFTCTFVNCEFECTSGYPALYAHSWEVSAGVTNLVKQKLVLKNCTFINTSTSGNPTIQLQSQEWPDTDATLLFIDNVVVNEGGGDTIGMHIYRDNGGALDGYMGSSDWTLSPLSYGNNISGMNA